MKYVNYAPVIDRVEQMNLHTSEFNHVPKADKEARLYIFTPKVMPTQILRPQKYEFSENLADEIRNTPAIGMHTVFNNRQTGPAIMPTATGTPLDLYVINQAYSFVLIIDINPNARYGGVLSALSTTRTIMLGYVLGEEPYNHATGTINPNAILRFTHSTTVRKTNEIGAAGIANKLTISNDIDYINELTGQQAPQELFLATPGDLVSPYIGEDGLTLDVSDLSVSKSKLNNSAFRVDYRLRSPVSHLHCLADGLNSSVNHSNASEVTSEALSGNEIDPYHNAKGHFKYNIPNNNPLAVAGTGLEGHEMISIGALDQMMDDALHVHTYSVPGASQWDIYDQSESTVKNVMSSFASMTISSIVTTCGLAHIVFRYASWVRGDSSSYAQGNWEIMGCSTMMELPSEAAQIDMLNKFKGLLEKQLFPTLKQVSGDFDIMAYVNAGGEVLVDLNFLDLNPSLQNVGFYETNTRLGGMLNPLLMDQSTLAHNAFHINTLANKFIDKAISSKPYDDNYNPGANQYDAYR